MNPVERILEEKELSLSELAFLAALDVSVVSRVLHGGAAVIPKKMLNVLQGIGYDPLQIQEEYKAWRIEEARKIVNKHGN